MRCFSDFHVDRLSTDVGPVLQIRWASPVPHRPVLAGEKNRLVSLRLLVPGIAAAYFTSAMAPFSVPRFSSARLLSTEAGLVNLQWIRCWLSLASAVHPFDLIATS